MESLLGPSCADRYDPKKHGTGRWKFSSDEWSAGVLTIEERDFYDVNGGTLWVQKNDSGPGV